MRSKQDLLKAIIGPTVDGVLDDFRAAVDDQSDPVERLRRAVRVYALRHATHRREALVANRDTTSLPEPARTRVRQRERDHERAVRAIICDGVGTGDFHVDSPPLASFAILEMCLSIARWFRDDGARTAEEVADEYTDFALRIVGFVPDRPSPADRAQQGPDDRTGERTTSAWPGGADEMGGAGTPDRSALLLSCRAGSGAGRGPGTGTGSARFGDPVKT